ncbi:hypothetical protein G7Y79_00113g101740 [Physcia stellaris]|nr:hypothetical protein G7Y79_00113g101740 [Physcia stellaris]
MGEASGDKILEWNDPRLDFGVILRHLQANLPKIHPSIELHVFSSVRSQSFFDFLKASGVYFVMAHDGANVVPISKDYGIQNLSEKDRANVETQEHSRKLGFRAMICYLIIQGYNVALINGVEWQDTKVVTTVVEGSRRARSLTGLSSKATETQNGNNQVELPDTVDTSLSKLGLTLDIPTENGTSNFLSNKVLSAKQGHSLQNGETDILTERSYLGILTLAALLKAKSVDRLTVLAFLLHMVLAREMSLSARHLHPTKPEQRAFIEDFLAVFSREASKIVKTARWGQTMKSNSVTCDVVDILDGRLFIVTLGSLKAIFNTVMSEPRLTSSFSRLTQALEKLDCGQVDVSDMGLPSNPNDPKVQQSEIPFSSSTASILPFTSPVFDKHLASIQISVAGNRPPRPESARIFQEVTHWHNAKRKLDNKAYKEQSGREKSRALRRNQFFMAEMFSYAASLTNSAGKILDPEVITVGKAKKATTKMLEANKENESKAKGNKNPGSKAGSNKKNVGKQAMLSNIAASKAAKEDDVTEKTFKAWETVRRIFDSETHPASRYAKARSYSNDPASSKRKAVEAEVEFYKIWILRADDDSVLVYVAPTKALVNQIAAEIQARFKKTYQYNKSVWAIHTRDYRINNPNGCQVLVTVPHILQIMLLSPSNARSWSPRLKYIIFDEIHSIGQAEDGVVWEQLLLLAPCPIIALSATVGNPEQFNSWLKSTQESIGNELTMITHPHRYSDLRKFIYTPPKKFQFNGLTDRGSFATLGLDGLAGGIPNDLSLEARDCLSLWQAMTHHQTKDFPVSPELDPAKAVAQIIRKADIIVWEKKLKELLRKWMDDDASPFDKVVEDLSKSMDSSAEEFQSSKQHGTDGDSESSTTVDPESLQDTTLPLLCKLQERNALPAIFFNYDRHKCEVICHSVLWTSW